MAGKPLELILERVIWKTGAWIGGKPMDNIEYSLVAPHHHILKEGLTKGKHTLTLEVDNTRQYDVSVNNLAHAYTNDTQTMWNGVLGKMTLRNIPTTDIRRNEIYTSVGYPEIKSKVIIDNNSKGIVTEILKFHLDGNGETLEKEVCLSPGENIVEAVLSAEGLDFWNEFHPSVYHVTVSSSDDSMATSFGIREVDNKEGLRVNGIPIFLRGTLECCVFPLNGVPPTDKTGWQKTFRTAKEWGLNHLRFHSWCPPEAAFEVADSMGFYLQVELPVW